MNSVTNIVIYRDVFADYMSLERNYSSRTVASYCQDLLLFERFLLSQDNSLTLPLVDSDLIRMWMAYLMEEGKSTTTVNRKLSSLRSFYRFMEARGYVDKSPAWDIRGPKNRKPLPLFLKESEMDNLLDNDFSGDGFVSSRDRAIIATFYETGIRLAELVGLDNKDVDFSGNYIKVTGKRNKQRVIPFGEELKDMLFYYSEQRDSKFGSEQVPFFLSIKGSRIPRHQVYLMVKRVLGQVSSISKKSPHVLRHTFATAMLNNDAELGAVKELLGHESLSTTEIYTHTTFQKLKEVYKQAHPRA